MQNNPIKENDDDMFGGAAPAKPGGRRAKDKDLFGTPKRLVIAKVLRAHAQASIKAIAQAQRRAQAGKAKSYEDAEYLLNRVKGQMKEKSLAETIAQKLKSK